MDKISKIRCSKKLINNLKDCIFLNYEELIRDYSKTFSETRIKKSFIKQRVFARLLSFRSIQPNVIDPIVKEIEKKIGKKVYLAPLFYIRYCYPDEYFNKDHKKSLLYTEPHYDKYTFNNKGMSFWIPLHKTSKSTGTLCYIKKTKKISNIFSSKGKNLFNIKNYIKEHKNIDPIIKKNVRNVFCNFGDILCFDQDVLHGASGPKTKPRISLNFQVTFSKKYKENKSFYATNKFLSHKNLINSLKFGDKIFYKRNKKFYSKIFERKLPNFMMKNFVNFKFKNTKIKHKNLLHDVHYSEEDSWIK